MDYKELIDQLKSIRFSYATDGLMRASICEEAATAIETLLAERDMMVAERNAAVDELRGVCNFCKHSPPSYRKTACYDCCEDYHNWQWRGPQKGGG